MIKIIQEVVQVNGEGESQGNSGSDQESKSNDGGSSNQSGQGEGNSSSSSNEINVTEMVKEPIIGADYDNVQWEELKTDIETFVSSWNTIILDLYKININSTDINDFSTQLDNLLIGIKNKDKIASLNSAVSLYSYIPKYIESYAQQSITKKIADTKLHILNSYVGASSENWDYVITEMNLAEQVFATVMSDSEFVKNNEYNANKIYVSLKELQNSIKTNDKTIFFIKYKNLMQELDILS